MGKYLRLSGSSRERRPFCEYWRMLDLRWNLCKVSNCSLHIEKVYLKNFFAHTTFLTQGSKIPTFFMEIFSSPLLHVRKVRGKRWFSPVSSSVRKRMNEVHIQCSPTWRFSFEFEVIEFSRISWMLVITGQFRIETENICHFTKAKKLQQCG